MINPSPEKLKQRRIEQQQKQFAAESERMVAELRREWVTAQREAFRAYEPLVNKPAKFRWFA